MEPGERVSPPVVDGGKSDNALAKAKAHWAQQIAKVTHQFEVPEWGLTVYVRPKTLKHNKQITEFFTEFDNITAGVKTLQLRCLDKDGYSLFQIAEEGDLMSQTDPAVIRRIIDAIGEFDERVADAQDAEKNSETTRG